MSKNTAEKTYTATIAWKELDGFKNGRAILHTETDTLTLTAASAAHAIRKGHALVEDLRRADEGIYLLGVEPA